MYAGQEPCTISAGGPEGNGGAARGNPYELYGAPEDVNKEPGWPEGLSKDMVFEVDVAGKKMILAKAGEPLLNAWIGVAWLCRLCAGPGMQCLPGSSSRRKGFVPSQATVRESDRKAGCIHSCVSYRSTI